MSQHLAVVLLRHLLGDAGVRHIFRCVEYAEREEIRRNGWSPPATLNQPRKLLALAVQEITGSTTTERGVAAAAPAVSASARGSAEVPRAKTPAGWSQIEWTPTREAAEMLGCTDRNVRDLCARGVFVTARRDTGGSWFVDRTELLERVERRDDEGGAL